MASRFNIENGMTVRSADGDKLGKIVAIEGATFLVEKGIFFPKDYTANLNQIDHVNDDGVFLTWGTNLVESNYDELYGAGSYGRETSSEEWRPYSRSGETTGEQRIPIREEELSAEKKGMRQVGQVRIHKTVKTEEKHFSVPVRREEVVIERTKASGRGEVESGPAFKEETTTIPIREEEVEITTRPVVKEEIRIHTQESQVDRPVAGQVRKEEVEINRESGHP